LGQCNEPVIPGTRRIPRHELPRPPEPLRPARLRDLRRLHSTLLLTAGIPVRVVAERRGHADPAIMLRVYTYATRQHGARVATPFAAAVDGDAPSAANHPNEDAHG
jgi:integrase